MLNLDINNFQQVIDLIDTLNLNPPTIPNYVPPQDGRWYNPYTLDSRDSLYSSVWCLDVETICDTKKLVMASAWDVVNQTWWCWISKPGTNPRLSFEGKNIIVAHRSTFELGFIKQSYDLGCQIRFLDTHVMACTRYHPAKVNLYRQMSYLPMFRGSNDLSLAELSLKLCGRQLNKATVDIFVTSQDESWRDSHLQVNKDVIPTIRKHLGKLVELESIEQFLISHCSTGKTVDADETLKPLLTNKKLKESKWLWRVTPMMAELCEYNYTDVSATMGVFKVMWQWYRELPFEYIAGLYHRGVPLLPLARDWFDKIEEIEEEYAKRVQQMVRLVASIEQDYLETVGKNDWDYFDWKTWGKTVKDKSRVGQYKWIGDTGLSSKKLMRLARLSWQGRPMLVLESDKKDSEGNPVVKKDGETSKVLVWHTVKRNGTWLESVQVMEDLQILDNPTNTSGEFKDIVTVFSKTFLPSWESGELTSESSAAQEIAKVYASISFWNSFRDRIINKAPIYNTGDYFGMCLRPLVNGTVTNRAIDSIGLVMAKTEESKVGTEIGGYICCPDGYKFVFADFDSIQAVITALYAAVGTAKLKGNSRQLIDCLNNPYSVAVLNGNKADRTTLAYLIADQAGISYAHGKNCQYAMLFGAGFAKLALMLGSEKLASEVIKYFKGEFNKQTRQWEGGIASTYFNFSAELAQGLTMLPNGRFTKVDELETTFLHRPMPNILRPSHRGRDLGGTAQNAVTQAVDVDCLCWITNAIITQCTQEAIFIRYGTSVHDALYVIAKEEDCPRVAEIFQECHRRMYQALLKELRIDPETFPKHLWQYSGVDINSRYTKTTGDLGKTLSNLDGYDYNVTASFLHSDDGDDEGVMLAEDFQSSKQMVKFYRQAVSRETKDGLVLA